MKFKYRNHVITINDKVVECFTGMIEPTITEGLFDSYADVAYRQKGKCFEDIDFSKFTNEELSKTFEDAMIDECQVYFDLRGAWKKELQKSN